MDFLKEPTRKHVVLEAFRSTSASAPAEISATGNRNAMSQGRNEVNDENLNVTRLLLAIIGIVALFFVALFALI
jgi:hypothetical protein